MTKAAGAEPTAPFAIAEDRLTAKEDDIRICGEGREDLLHAGSGLRRGGRAPFEIDIRLELHGPAQACLMRRVIRADVGAPGAIAFLKAQGFDCAVACVREPMGAPCLVEGVIDCLGIFDGQVQLPAELAHIGDPAGQNRAARDADPPRRREGVRGIGDIGAGAGGEDIAGLGTEQGEHRVRRGHIHQLRVETGGNVALDPMEIARGKAGAGDNVELILGKPRDGDVAFDAAAIVEHLRVDDRPHRAIHAVCGDPLQGCLCVRAFEDELGKGGLVEKGRSFARRFMLPAHRCVPVGALEGVDVVGRFIQRCVPIRTFPPKFFPKDSALGFERVVERGAAAGAAGAVLFRRPGHGVMLAIGLERAGADPIGVGMGPAKAANIDGPEIIGRRASGDPFGQRHPRAAARGDAIGVEARADVEAGQLRGFAKDKVAIRREAFGAVDQLFDARLLHFGHARQGQLHDLLEVIKIGLQELEIERIRHAVLCPWDAIGLVPAHDQAAHLFLPIGQAIGIAQCGQVARHAEGFSNHVLMLNRHQRDGDPDRGRQLSRPLPATEHQLFAGDLALIGTHADSATFFNQDLADRTTLDELCAFHARALGQRLRDVRGARLPVCWQIGGAHDIGDVHERPEILRLLRGQKLHIEAEAVRGGGLTAHLGPALFIASQPQTAVHFPSRGEAGLLFERIVERNGVTEELSDIGGTAQLADKTRRVPGGARRQLRFVEQQDFLAHMGEVIGRGAANDAAADDDDFGRCRQGHGRDDPDGLFGQIWRKCWGVSRGKGVVG